MRLTPRLLSLATYATVLLAGSLILTATAQATGTERAPTGTTVVGKSRAPAPITPIRGGASGKETGVDSNGEFHGSFQAWKAARLAGKIR